MRHPTARALRLQLLRSIIVSVAMPSLAAAAPVGQLAYLAGAVGVGHDVRRGVEMPVVPHQAGGDRERHDLAVPQTAFAAPRFSIQVGLLSEEEETPALALRLSSRIPGAFVRDASPSLGGTFVASRTLGQILTTAEAGAELRKRSEQLDAPASGSEALFSASLSTLGKRIRGEITLMSAVSFLEDLAPSIEGLVGGRLLLAHGFEIVALGGYGFKEASGTPAFRMVGGIAWGDGATALVPSRGG